MKRTSLIILIGLTIAVNSLHATQQNLYIGGPPMWMPGTTVVLSVTDVYSGFGGGSYGLSYLLQVSNSIAPFLTITQLTYFTFTDNRNYNGGFPVVFDSNGFENADLGASDNVLIPDRPYDGTDLPDFYHITDITFALAAGAPAGTYTLRTTTASPRVSFQITSDHGEAPLPEARFVFTVVPEPSTLALIGLTVLGAGVMTYRRRNS